MIANRWNPLAIRHTSKTAKDYVQDGLIAMWDGVENAGWGKHDANATVWKDLVGGANFRINDIDHTRFVNNALQMDFVTKSKRVYADAAIRFVTLEIVGKYDQGSRIIFIDEADTSRPAVIFQINGVNIQYTNGQTKLTTTSNNFNRILPLSVVYDETVQAKSVFIDNAKQELTDGSNSWNVFKHPTFVLGSRIAYQGAFGGNFYSIRLYNRALTDEEISHNYTVDRERFGI